MPKTSANFDFRKPVAYDGEAKRAFHNHARRRLKQLADALGLSPGAGARNRAVLSTFDYYRSFQRTPRRGGGAPRKPWRPRLCARRSKTSHNPASAPAAVDSERG